MLTKKIPISFIKPVANWLFGFDFFISYAWSDGRIYAKELYERLERDGYTCFLDSNNYAKGDDWKKIGKGQLLKTKKLILIGTPNSLTSKPILREVKIFSSTSRRIVPIDFGNTISEKLNSSALKEYLPEAILSINEKYSALSTGKPSISVIEELKNSFSLVRQREIRKRALTAAISVLFALAITSLSFGLIAERNRNSAVDAQYRALERVLAISASSAMEGEPSLKVIQRSAAMAQQANQINTSPQAWSAATRTISKLPTTFYESEKAIQAALIRPGALEFAIALSNGFLSLKKINGKEIWSHKLSEIIEVIWSPNGESIFIFGGSNELIRISSNGAVEWKKSLIFLEKMDTDNNKLDFLKFLNDKEMIMLHNGTLAIVNVDGEIIKEKPLKLDISKVKHCGKLLVLADEEGGVWSFDISLNKEAQLINKHKGFVESLDCVQNGKSIASIGSDDILNWKYEGKNRQSLHTGSSNLFLSKSGNYLAILTLEQGRNSFNIKDGKNETLLFSINQEKEIWRNYNTYQSNQAFFIGDKLITADEKKSLLLVDPTNINEVKKIPLPHQLDYLGLLDENENFVFVSVKGVVGIVDTTMRHVRRVAQLTDASIKIGLSADRKVAVMFSNPNVVEFGSNVSNINIAATVRFDTLTGLIKLPDLQDFDVKPDNHAIIVQNFPTVMHKLNIEKNKLDILWSHKQPIQGIRINSNNGQVLVEGNSRKIILLNDNGSKLWDADGLFPDPDKYPFSKDNKYLVLANERFQVELLETLDGSVATPQHWVEQDSSIWKVSSDLEFAAFVGHPLKVKVLSKNEKKVFLEYKTNDGVSFQFDPDGKWFAGVDHTNTLIWYDLISKKKVNYNLKTEANYNDPISIFNGQSLISVGINGISLLDLPYSSSPIKETVFASSESIEEALDLSSNDEMILLALKNNSALIVNLKTGKETFLPQFGQRVTAGTFSANTNLVALASSDGEVRVYDITTNRMIISIREDIGSISKISFIESEGWLLISGQSGGLAIQINPFKELCQRAIPNLEIEFWTEIGGIGKPKSVCKESN